MCLAKTWGYGQSLTPVSCTQLRSLEKLRQLRSVRCVNWETLPLSGFEALIRLPGVTELDLTNCTSITDNILRQFRSVQSRVEILVLSGCDKITDEGILHLTTLIFLKDLRCVFGSFWKASMRHF